MSVYRCSRGSIDAREGRGLITCHVYTIRAARIEGKGYVVLVPTDAVLSKQFGPTFHVGCKCLGLWRYSKAVAYVNA